MAYRFKLGEDFDDGLRRIGAEQLRQAIGRLEAAQTVPEKPTAEDITTSPSSIAVHDVRKCIKRLRALLRLARPGIGEETFKRLNTRLRDTARSMSGARDAAVLSATIERLSRLPDADIPAFARLKALLDGEPPASAMLPLDTAIVQLHKVERAWAKLRLDPSSFAPLGAGLGTVYQRCIDAAAAMPFDTDTKADGPARAAADEALHTWRKSVQQHWRHMRLFELAWPLHMAARIAQAKELSEILGKANDLAVYIGVVDTLSRPDGTGLSRRQTQRLIAQAQDEQAALRAAAKPRGERLFAEGTAGHVRRVELYWTTAVAMKRSDPKAEDSEPAPASIDGRIATAAPQTATSNPAPGTPARRGAAARSQSARRRRSGAA